LIAASRRQNESLERFGMLMQNCHYLYHHH
jgi:hypothetical protein